MPRSATRAPRPADRRAPAAAAPAPAAPTAPAVPATPTSHHPAQTVLVLQGGGALGAYQWGVYQALHEQGVEPDWVIGTSIGAVNAALIAGNAPADRLARLAAFWHRVQQPAGAGWAGVVPSWAQALARTATITGGLPGFFSPRPQAWLAPDAPLGAEQASYYRTDALSTTLGELVDLDRLASGATRITVGAVEVASARMRYFDSGDRSRRFTLDEVLASGALPPAFAGVRIDGQVYWDGGLYSNTPIEAVFDDVPRRDSLVFSVNVWQPRAPEPTTLNAVLARQKDIQYASREDSHLARQAQLHHLRHVVRALSQRLGVDRHSDPDLRELAGWGCGTTMQVIHLQAPALPGEDAAKDIDFTPAGIEARRAAGHRAATAMLRRAPWRAPTPAGAGVVQHHASED